MDTDYPSQFQNTRLKQFQPLIIDGRCIQIKCPARESTTILFLEFESLLFPLGLVSFSGFVSLKVALPPVNP